MADDLLAKITETLTTSDRLEILVRRLLEMLELVTGLESTYLTEIDLQANVQRVLFARNIRTLNIPEGLTVPWGDTLCKRALDEGRPYTNKVADCWGESDAARALGLRTYASTPVRLSDGSLFGTLCAASAHDKPMAPRGPLTLTLFAELISNYIEREQLLDKLEKANQALLGYSYTDALTDLSNRRAVVRGLEERLDQARRHEQQLLLVFIDLDDFKRINDEHGHDTGDDFLRAVAQRLERECRPGDLLGRLGGDEFILAALVREDEAPAAMASLRQRLDHALTGRYELDDEVLDYKGASMGVITLNPDQIMADQALAQADHAMYEDKHRRKQQA